MDPNELLDTIRRLTTIYRNGGDWDENETDALIEHIENLDDWITRYGFLPTEWGGKTAADMRR